jgi:hypothetical protein
VIAAKAVDRAAEMAAAMVTQAKPLPRRAFSAIMKDP